VAFFSLNKNKDDASGLHAMTDDQLIVRYKATSDSRCIEVLFDRYIHLVFGVSMKYLENEEESKDAVMDIFEDLFDLLLEHNITNFKSWLHTVTRNFCLMKLRSPRKREVHDDKVLINTLQNNMENGDSDHHIEQEKNIGKLNESIGKLCEEQRKCIELMYLNDKSYKEIVNITGYSLKNVKSYIQNGKRNLKILMMKGG